MEITAGDRIRNVLPETEGRNAFGEWASSCDLIAS
jgi:hypothetical protein